MAAAAGGLRSAEPNRRRRTTSVETEILVVASFRSQRSATLAVSLPCPLKGIRKNVVYLSGTGFEVASESSRCRLPGGSLPSPLLAPNRRQPCAFRHSTKGVPFQVSAQVCMLGLSIYLLASLHSHRPPWTKTMSADELDYQERSTFLAWRRRLAECVHPAPSLFFPCPVVEWLHEGVVKVSVQDVRCRSHGERRFDARRSGGVFSASPRLRTAASALELGLSVGTCGSCADGSRAQNATDAAVGGG